MEAGSDGVLVGFASRIGVPADQVRGYRCLVSFLCIL